MVREDVFGTASFAGSAVLGISFGASIGGDGAAVPGTGGNAHPTAPITMPPDGVYDAHVSIAGHDEYEAHAGAANFAFNLASNPGLEDAHGSHAAGEERAKSGRLIRGVPQGAPQPGDGKRAFSRANKPGPAAHGSHDTIAGAAHGSAQPGSEPAIHAELIKSNAVFTGCNLHNKLTRGNPWPLDQRSRNRDAPA